LGSAAFHGGRSLTLTLEREHRLGKVRRKSPVRAETVLGAPFSVLRHGGVAGLRLSTAQRHFSGFPG
jgi:hypothetical protein